MGELTIMVKMSREEADQALQQLYWLNSKDKGLSKIAEVLEIALLPIGNGAEPIREVSEDDPRDNR